MLYSQLKELFLSIARFLEPGPIIEDFKQFLYHSLEMRSPYAFFEFFLDSFGGIVWEEYFEKDYFTMKFGELCFEFDSIESNQVSKTSQLLKTSQTLNSYLSDCLKSITEYLSNDEQDVFYYQVSRLLIDSLS